MRCATQSFWVRTPLRLGCGAILLFAVAVVAQETVTIPKARLEELERKEAELEKLKGELNLTRDQNLQLKQQHETDAHRLAQPAAPVIPRLSAPIHSLPPLKATDTVEALDLANYYRANPQAADARYRKRTFKVTGEIIAFEKPPLVSDYHILLKTDDRELRMVCDVYPPEKYTAILTVKNGSELDGQLPGRARVPIAKVGQTAVIQGQCRGLKDSVVKFSACQLISVH
jgi:putative nucleic acid binding protein